MKSIETLRPFTRFCCTIGNLPTSYMESLTYEEQLIWLCNYLENVVIPAVNNNAEAVKELQDLYVVLKDYVDNYFNNLDVQQEINNKLDAMAADGSLTNLIKSYIDPLITQQNNKIDTLIAEQNNKIDTTTAEQNNKINTIKNEVDSATSGSPAGVFATVEELQSSLTALKNKIYLVEADGKWYFYDTTSSAWVPGGVYQTSGISDNSIKYAMLETGLQKNCVPSKLRGTSYTTKGAYYKGYNVTQVDSVLSSHFNCGSIDVTPGETLIVPFFFQSGEWYDEDLSYATVYPIILADATGNIIQKIEASSLISNDNIIQDFKMTIPSGVTKVYFNSRISPTSPDKPWLPYITTEYNYNDLRLNEYLETTEEIDVKSTESLIYSMLNWGYNFGGFTSYFYDVEPFEKINIKTKLHPSNQFLAGIYVDINKRPVGYVKPVGSKTEAIIVDSDSIVPANATQLIVCPKVGESVHVYKYKLAVSSSSTKKITATYTDGILTMTNNDNNNYVKMQNYGGNNLFMVREYKVGNNTVTLGTDMTPAPYVVDAVNNADGDRTGDTKLYGFTGGNHQWNNLGSGSTPTSRQTNLLIYCDGIQMVSNTTKKCNEVKIIEINRVQGTNTCKEDGSGREILEEKIIFTFDGKTLKVKNTITPLEEIIIKTYFGIQMNDCNNEEYKVYADKIYNNTTIATLKEKPYQIYGINVSSKLYDCGLGDYRYNTSSDYKVTISNRKSYFVPVYANRDIFTTSNINYIEGEYIFDSNQL